MKRNALLICLSLALLAAPPAAAQEAPEGPAVTGPDTPILVQVQLLPQGKDPRRIVIWPRAAAVCRYDDDCAGSFTVRWIGPPGEPGEKIRIQFTTPGSGECFDMTDFTIDGTGPGNQKAVSLLRDNPSCPNKWFFFYDVSCVGGTGGDCGGVKTVDPGAMVDGGRR